jgi:hypothetical protein
VTILTGVTPLTFDYGTEGTVARVDVTDGGAGYESAGLLTVEDLAATGGALTNMTGEFEFEGVVGSLTDNAVTLLTGGTGYDPGTDASGNDIVGNLLDESGVAIVCATRRLTPRWRWIHQVFVLAAAPRRKVRPVCWDVNTQTIVRRHAHLLSLRHRGLLAIWNLRCNAISFIFFPWSCKATVGIFRWGNETPNQAGY